MSGDIIPNNFDMIPYSTFHTALLPHPNPLGPGNPSNISTGLMLTAQQPNGQNPYCPPITLTNGYYTNVNYPHNAESFCYVQPNDANSILNAYHTYPTSINLPLQATHISCDKLYTSNNHISNNNNHNHNHITAQNPLLSTINTNHITMNNNNYNDKNELGKRLEMIGVEKSNSLLDESSQGIIDKSTILSSLSSTSTSTTTTINTHGENENIQQNTSLLVLRLLMSGKEVGSIIGKVSSTCFVFSTLIIL
uniref:Putative poly(Rc) binding protien n=1 Tax=Schistosoma mansoni TaxID=6183 RepID=A0A5K4EM56_SCHMA